MTISRGKITPEQARLPDQFEKVRPRLETMNPGQWGYMRPEQLWLDQKGYGWLEYKAVIKNKKTDFTNMMVVKTNVGFIADIENVDYLWERSNATFPADSFAPVVGLITSSRERSVVYEYLRTINPDFELED